MQLQQHIRYDFGQKISLYHYNIHNIAKVQSEVPLYELEYFSCDAFPKPDMVVKVKDLNLGAQFKRSIITDEYKTSRKIKYAEHLGRFGAQFTVNFSDPIEISVNGLIARSRHVLYVNLVEPILRFLMIAKGYVLLHAACMDLNGHGILFSAPPDTGKTSTVLKCVRKEFSFLSDDMTIISLPNNALCFPKPMTISAHTFKTAVNLSNGHLARGLWLRSMVHSKGGRGFMRKLGGHNVPIFTINTVGQAIIKPPKFKIEDVLQGVSIQDRTHVEKLCFLQGGGEEISEIPVEIAVEKAIENSEDAFLFPPYREMLEYINIGGKSAQRLLEEERDMLTKFLTSIDSFILKSESRSWYQMVHGVAVSSMA